MLNCNDDDYSQEYSQTKEVSRALSGDEILEPYISDNDFRSTNNGNFIVHNLYVFDIRYQKNFESAQPIKVEFKFDGVFPAGIYGYALFLTNKVTSISSDGQRHSDLIYVKFILFTTIFSFIVNSVFFNKASLYLSVKLSIL